MKSLVENRIQTVEKELEELRLKYKEASPPLKTLLAQKGKQKATELLMLKGVIERREKRDQEQLFDEQKSVSNQDARSSETLLR